VEWRNLFKSSSFTVWISRGFVFVFTLSILLSIKNNFNVYDEYYYAIHLLKVSRAFHNFHLLSNPVAYITWFFASIFGFQVSAFRVLQITSSIFAALGATALVDMGMFWGLSFKRAFIFSIPIIFCNAFIRYGTSAYPDSLALGMGLVAVNIFIRSLSIERLNQKPRLIFVSGLFMGLACLMHMAFSLVIPVLLMGVFFIFWRNGKSLLKSWSFVFSCSVGILLVLGLGYAVLLPLCLKCIPEQTSCYEPLEVSGYGLPLTILTGKVSSWFPGIKDLFTDFKTHGALFIPGVHSENVCLDIALGFPRILAFILLGWFAFKALLSWKKNTALANWIIIFSMGVIFEFIFILFAGLSICRNYIYVILSVIGPLFVAMLILAFNNSVRYKFTLFLFTIIIIFYSIFGVEGVVDITTHDNRPFKELYKQCDVHTPKYLKFPLSLRASLYPECYYDNTLFEKYGHLGPPAEFLEEKEVTVYVDGEVE
jgi:MFS family permease